MKMEARLYEKSGDNKVHCFLCSHQCKIAPSKFGICGVRQNREGTLFTYAYGEVIARHIDPIEKKPLYHFLPGSYSYSIAAAGCNFKCEFCQNWQISQVSHKKGGMAEGTELTPEAIVQAAAANGCKSISYTYTEPTIFFEYAFDTARLAKQNGIRNVFVTNGYMSPQCLEAAQPYLDACNVDLKSFQDSFYQKTCGGHLQPVLDSIRLMRQLRIWVEVTSLIIPGMNDSAEELESMARFIADVDSRIPWHVSRFHPDYRMPDVANTPVETLEKAKEIGKRNGLQFVYAGNVAGEQNTACRNCGQVLIRRSHFSTIESRVRNGNCPECQSSIPGIWE